MKVLRTNKYALHHFETNTGLKFVVTSDLETAPLSQELKDIYSNIYVPLIVKNPLINPRETIVCENFKSRMTEVLKAL